VSDDPTRERLARAFTPTPVHVAGCNGHMLAAVKFDGVVPAGAEVIRDRAEQAPAIECIDETLTCIGEMVLPPRLNRFPVSWTVHVVIAAGGGARVEAFIPAKQHAKTRKIIRDRVTMIDPQPIEGFEALRPEQPIGVDGHYLDAAARVVTLGYDGPPWTVYVHAAGPMDPIVLAPAAVRTRVELLDLDRFALVMPMRL
jgi:hypothetical protein